MNPKSNERRLAEAIYAAVLTIDDKISAPNFDGWERTLGVMIKANKTTCRQARAVFEWAHQDEKFWKARILSPQKLSKHYVKLAKQMAKNKITRKNIYSESFKFKETRVFDDRATVDSPQYKASKLKIWAMNSSMVGNVNRRDH